MQQSHLFESLSSARKILESLKVKLSPLTFLPPTSSKHKNDENQPYIANNANPPKVKVSDQMEIHWLKSTIDRLCKDNALLYQDINEILRILEVVGISYKELRDKRMEKTMEKTNEELKILRQKLDNEQNSNSRLRMVISEMKVKYERLIEALKTYSEEETIERIDEEKLIGKLTKENEYLRKMLYLNSSEEELAQFAKEMSEKEQQFRFLKNLEMQKDQPLDEIKEEIHNEEPNWEKDYKDLNEMCEKMMKDKKTKENNSLEPQFANEFNEEFEDFDDFENFEQFLKNFKSKSKSENHYKNLEIPENPKDFLEIGSLGSKRIKGGLHKRSKTNTEILPGSLDKTHNQFQQYLKKFSMDDTFL